MALIPGKMTYYAFYVTTFPIGSLLGMHSYSLRGEKTGSWEVLYLYMTSRLAALFGGVTNRERKHQGKKACEI